MRAALIAAVVLASVQLQLHHAAARVDSQPVGSIHRR
jgi:hypothetical protein